MDRATAIERAIELSGIGVVYADDDGVHFDHSLFALLGHDPAQVSGDPREWLMTIAHPDDVTDLIADSGAMLTGTTPRRERAYRLRGADGEYVWVHRVAARGPEGVVAVFRRLQDHAGADDTARVIEQLEHTNRTLQMLVDHMPVGLVTYRFDGLRRALVLSRANQFADQMLGYAISDRVGRPIAEAFPSVRPEAMARLVGVARRGGTFQDRAISYDREGVPQSFDSAGFHSAPDEVTVLFWDASDALDLERTRLVNQQLEQFAYAVSHDLRAPLRGIRLSAGWLEDELGDDMSKDARQNLGFIQDRVARLTTLIDNILTYSQAQRDELTSERFDLGPVVAGVVADLAPTHSLTVLVDDDLPDATGDPVQVGRVIRNLLDNAIKYHDRPDGKVWITCEAADPDWRLTVRDDGPGIPESDRQRVFELFATGRQRSEPGGIGLALCRALVQRWGGEIAIEDAPPRGTAVWFTLPPGEAA